MAERTGISWTDRTWSPWIGCQKVSPACDGCYAEHLMDTRLGRVEWGPHGERKLTSEDYWRKPLAWDRTAAKAGKGVTVFPSLCDPFDNKAPPGALRQFFDLIRATPHLTWILLTKRPQNIERLYGEAHLDLPDGGSGYDWPANAWAGTTAEDQPRADANLPALLKAKAELRIPVALVSVEPMMGPVDIRRHMWPVHWHWDGKFKTPQEALAAGAFAEQKRQALVSAHAAFLDWVIAGGETDQGKHKARPSHPEWFRSLRDQCAAAGVPFHFKQWGEWTPGENAGPVTGPSTGAFLGSDGGWYEERFTRRGAEDLTCDDEPDVWRVGKKRSGRLLDGVQHDAMPAVRP